MLLGSATGNAIPQPRLAGKASNDTMSGSSKESIFGFHKSGCMSEMAVRLRCGSTLGLCVGATLGAVVIEC